MTSEVDAMDQNGVTVMMPEAPAYRPTPAHASIEVFTAPVPAAAVPAAVVPTIAAARVPIIFRLSIGAVAPLASDGDWPSGCAAYPALGVELVALRQHERRLLSDRAAVDRDAQAVRIDDRDHLLLVLKRLQLPNLVIAAIAFGNDDRVAGAWGLIGGPGQTIEAKPASGQVTAILVAEPLVGLSGAVPNRQALAGLILGSWNIDAPIGGAGREHGFESIEAVGAGRKAHEPKHECGDHHPRPETELHSCLTRFRGHGRGPPVVPARGCSAHVNGGGTLKFPRSRHEMEDVFRPTRSMACARSPLFPETSRRSWRSRSKKPATAWVYRVSTLRLATRRLPTMGCGIRQGLTKKITTRPITLSAVEDGPSDKIRIGKWYASDGCGSPRRGAGDGSAAPFPPRELDERSSAFEAGWSSGRTSNGTDEAGDSARRDQSHDRSRCPLRLCAGRCRLRAERAIPAGTSRRAVWPGPLVSRVTSRCTLSACGSSGPLPAVLVSGTSRTSYRWQPKICSLMPGGRTSAGAPARREKLKARFVAVRVRTADGPPQRIRDKGQQHLPGDEAWLIGECEEKCPKGTKQLGSTPAAAVESAPRQGGRSPPWLPCQVAAWPGEAADKTKFDRVFGNAENDWDRRACRFGCQRCCRASGRCYHGDPPTNSQLGLS